MEMRAVGVVFLLALCGAFAAADSYEPDNSIANATVIPVDGTAQEHVFGVADADYVGFTAVQGRTYIVETQNITPQAITDTVVYVYWPNGTILVRNDDDLSEDTTDSRIVFQAPLTGTFYARVTEFNSNSGGNYTVSVTKMGVLSAELIVPASALNVTVNSTFNYTAVVSCSDGPCGAVTVILDPENGDAGDISGNATNSTVTNVTGNVTGNVSSGASEGSVPVVEARSVPESLTFAANPKERRNVDPLVLKELERSEEARVIVLLNPVKPSAQQRKKLGEHQAVRTAHEKARAGVLAATGGGFKQEAAYTTIPAIAGAVTEEGLAMLEQDPAVAYIGYDAPVHMTLDSSVPSIGVPAVWSQQFNGTNITGTGVTVCVIDTGVSYTHSDFGSCIPTANINDGSCPSVIGGFNYCPTDSCDSTNNDPTDNNGHGTHVAATIMGNHSTYRGVAPGAKVVAMKVLDSSGSGFTSDVIAAMDWCVANATRFNISVISMSLGANMHNANCDRLAEGAAVDAARNAGILVVAAAGNEFDDSSGQLGLGTPSCITNATSVGSTDDATAYSGFSNRDTGLDLLAPGSSVTAAQHTGGHVAFSGTSMATPHVAGAAALLIQQHRLLYGRSLTPLAIEQLLKSGGVNATDPYTGITKPRIDVLASSQLKGMVLTVPGSRPFWTPDTNPASCSLDAGENCTTSWSVNASSENGTYTFFAIYENEYSRIETTRVNVSIVPAEQSVSLSLAANQSAAFVNESVVFSAALLRSSGEIILVQRFNTTDLNFTNASVLPANSTAGELRWAFNGSNVTINTTFIALRAGALTVNVSLEQNGSALLTVNSTVVAAVRDTVAPVTTAFVADDISSSSATLVIETDENSTCRYSAADELYDSMVGNFTPLNASRHQLSLSGLDAETAYLYFSRCADGSGNTQASSSNISFTTDTAPRSGGGGGGGGAPRADPDAPEQSFRLGRLAAGEERTLTVERTKVPITAVSFVAAGAIPAATVRVQTADPPEEIGVPAPTVHSFISIEHPPSLLVAEASIDFSVPRSWLADEGVAAADVLLFRFHDGWQELPTRVVGKDGGAVHFRASTPGFSYFAIGVAEQTAPAVVAAEEVPLVEVVPSEPAPEEPAPLPLLSAAATPVRRELVTLPALLVMSLLAGMAAYFFIRRNHGR